MEQADSQSLEEFILAPSVNISKPTGACTHAHTHTDTHTHAHSGIKTWMHKHFHTQLEPHVCRLPNTYIHMSSCNPMWTASYYTFSALPSPTFLSLFPKNLMFLWAKKSHLDVWYCSIVSSWGPFQGPLPSQQGFCVLTSIAHHIFVTLGGSQGITTKTSGKTRSSVLSLFLCVCVCVLIVQSCPTPYNPRDCSPSGSSVYGILQARTLEWVAIPFSQGSSRPRDWTQISCIAGRSLYHLSHPGRPRALQPGQFSGYQHRFWAWLDFVKLLIACLSFSICTVEIPTIPVPGGCYLCEKGSCLESAWNDAFHGRSVI